MKQPCIHGLQLEKNMRCDKGYIQALMRHKGHTICKNFGIHTREAQNIANIFLSEKRKEFLQNKIGIVAELPSKRFAEVADIWFKIWQAERHPDGTTKHNQESCYKVRWTLDKALIPAFGERLFNEISEKHICQFRENYLDRGRSGVTANRYQAVLSSIFSHVDQWVKTEKIKPAFKLPDHNPCDAVEMAPQKKRKRILTKYEASKLKMAFLQLNDADGWEICKLALKSVLSLGDLKKLEIGQDININRSKTGVPVRLPLPVLLKLNWYGWRTRWDAARVVAGFAVWGRKGKRGAKCAKQCTFQFRDLRKTGLNWADESKKHTLKDLSNLAAHASERTTERFYRIANGENLRPIVEDLSAQVEAI